MSEFAGFDLDRSTARAWGAFQSRLADHIAAMEDDDLVLIEAESPMDEDDQGSAPYVQLCAWGETLVRGELSSNAYLAEEHELDDEQVAALVELGWGPPTHGPDDEPDSGSTNFYLDAERNQADRLAVMAIRALRDVFGVAHPAFLTSDNLATVDAAPPEHADNTDVEEPLAVSPADRDHLRALVDAALVPVFGNLPEHDADDDVPVVNGSGLVWVRVLEDAPVVQLFSALVRDITDRERAAFEVSVLNRDVQFLKFILLEDTVMAYLYIPAQPFAPVHLRDMLELMCTAVDRIDDDLAARVGGHRAFENAASEGEVQMTEQHTHPAMRTLIELDTAAPDSVDPELAAAICGGDRALVLELIDWNSEQERAWRHTREEALLEGDPDDIAGACETEMQQAERMTNLLRRALRVVVEREAGRPPERPGYDDSSGRRGRPRRARDEVLPGMDSPEPGLFDQ